MISVVLNDLRTEITPETVESKLTLLDGLASVPEELSETAVQLLIDSFPMFTKSFEEQGVTQKAATVS